MIVGLMDGHVPYLRAGRLRRFNARR